MRRKSKSSGRAARRWCEAPWTVGTLSGSGPRGGPLPWTRAMLPDAAAAAGVDVAARALFARRRRDRPRAAPRLGRAGRRARVGGHAAAGARRRCTPLRAEQERPALSVLVDDDDAARELAEAVVAYRPGAPVGYLPQPRRWTGARRSSPPPHLVGERARALDVLARGGIVAVSAEAARRAHRRARPPHRAGPGAPSATRSSATTSSRPSSQPATSASAARVEERGQVVGPRRRRRRLPDDRPRAAAHRAVRRRGRARLAPSRRSPSARCATSTQRARLPGAGAARRRRRRVVRRRRRRPRTCPTGLVPLAPELLAAGAARRLAAATVAGGRGASGCEVAHLPAGRAAAPTCGSRTCCELVERRARARRAAAGPAGHLRGPAPGARRRAASPRPRTSCARWSRAACACVVAFPHRGDAERTALQLRRVEARCSSRATRCRRRRASASSCRGCGAASWRRSWRSPCCPRRRSSAARSRRPTARVGRAIAVVHRPAARRLRRARGPRRRPLRRASTPRPSPASRATTSSLEFKGEDRLFVPHEQIGEGLALHRRRRPRAGAVQARRQGLAHAQGPRAARRARAGRRAARALRRPPGRAEKQPIEDDDELMRRLEAAFPYAETDDQARAIEAVKDDLESHAADGPPDLRRRRLRQDRGRDARGHEGRRPAAARC